MIRAIIFDFDGVIIESADVKTEAFRRLFCDRPNHLNEIVAHHLRHQGISRYVKFRYIYKNIIKKELTKYGEEKLGRRFSQIALREILKAPFVAGARQFLSSNKRRFDLFVASGTPRKELLAIISARGIEKYFKGIYGSPAEKADILDSIKKRYGFSKDEMIYVGDSQSDRIAARKAGIAFVERDASAPLGPRSPRGRLVVKDLRALEKVVKRIEKD